MAKVFALRRKSRPALRRRKAALLCQLATVPPDALRASFVKRFATCGTRHCRCRQGAKHGPFYYLTQCLAPGHVQKFLLKEHAHQAGARQGIAAYNQFYDRLEELFQINAELLRRGESLAAVAR